MQADDDTREIAYYREIEDYFATLRGVPHVLSPKDFQLLREWWHDQIPLPVVRAALAEVFARRRDRDEPDPVVSLSYCRHAVKAHAKRAAEMHVGSADGPVRPEAPDIRQGVETLASDLTAAADRLRADHPRIAELIDRFAVAVAAAAELPPAILEEHLFALESTLLANSLEALDDEARSSIETRSRADAESTAATPEARERTYRALRDRLMREELGLPRLELDG
jgi:hypothetical protein